jgi:DNA damage-binding protein 1
VVVDGGERVAMNRIGSASVPTCMSFIAPDRLFIGSHLGESSVLKLLEFPDATSSDLVKNEGNLPNLAPLLDFEVCDLEKRGQSLMYACSGAYGAGCIKVIGQGVGVLDLLDTKGFTSGVGGMWAVGVDETEMIVFGYYQDTRFVGVRGGGMEEVDGGALGFDVSETCVFVGDVQGGVVQVTEGRVLLVAGGRRSGEWVGGARICHASVCGEYVLVAIDGGILCLLRILEGRVEQVGYLIFCLSSRSCKFESEVSCVNIHLYRGVYLAAVGLWGDVGVRIYGLPGFDEKCRDILDGGIIVLLIVRYYMSLYTDGNV